MKARFVDVDGVKTRVLSAGEGPPLLLVHGVGVSADTFIRNIDVLGEHFAVYAPDIVGHGFTDRVDYAGRPPQLVAARHLLRLMDALGIESFSALGFSYGGLIASLLWFERPAAVEDLVVVGSGSVFHPPAQQVTTLRAAAANGAQAYSEASIEACRRRLANLCYDAASVPEEILPVQATSYALPDRFDAYKDTIEGTIACIDDPDARVFDRLEELTARTLVITGMQDPRSDVEWTRNGVVRIPNARLEVYDDCGHLPFVEHADRFNGSLIQFLQDRS